MILSLVSALQHLNAATNKFISHLGTRLRRNLISGTDERVTSYNDVFEELLQEFRDKAARDTMVMVHRIWTTVESLHENVKGLGKFVFNDQ
jgi:hypothetical protein